MSELGFIRVASITPKLIVANTEYNKTEIIECLQTADKSGCGIAVFPELCITGSTCGDLFHQRFLYQQSLASLKHIVCATENCSIAVILGLYIEHESLRFNCAALIQKGQIKGIVPKMVIPDVQSRWFSSGSAFCERICTVRLLGEDIPFGRLLFKDETSGVAIGIEVGEDRCQPVSPGLLLALNGAQILTNPSAEYDVAGRSDFKRNFIAIESARLVCGYAISSAGVHESTTDFVFSGQNLIAENGNMIAESSRFTRNSNVLYGDLDYELLNIERMRGSHFSDMYGFTDKTTVTSVTLQPLSLFNAQKNTLMRFYPKNPFLPKQPERLPERCSEIFEIQCAGLAKRLEHTKAARTVIGISGGLDSTLALLVCVATHMLLGKNPDEIVALTMPGFGTTGKTYQNALALMQLLGTTIREISIKDSVSQHFNDIGHDANIHNVTYENAQARERTQILMDVANQENGLLIGTGDLSESALGWCTFNGDHMSMYSVNAGVPKTLIRHIIKWVIDTKLTGDVQNENFSADNALLAKTLQDVLDTPISPELLPPDQNGEIAQKTEESVGPYPLNDFFIFHTVRFGMRPDKLFFLAKHTFEDEYPDEIIKKWLIVFYKRFFSQQFKRNCMPEGPKVGSVGLSPRGDWIMPSDADWNMWIKEIN